MASTGQIVQDIAEGMTKEFDVTVIGVVPSYSGIIEEKYKKQKFYYEELNGVKLIRVRVPEFSKSSKLSRVRNIMAYFWGALRATWKTGRQDYIFSISQPPILGGLLGVLGKWSKQAKFIYNIQDFNPEQVMAVGYSKNALLLKIAMFLDKFSCRHADLVVTVGRDLVETLKHRFNNYKVPKHVMINNWIDEKVIHPLGNDEQGVMAFKKKYGLEDKYVIMYSGNIGLYYDLDNLIKVIKKFPPGTKSKDGRDVIFAFVGAGTVLEQLKKDVADNNMSNVCFIPYQDKSKLIYSLNAGDVHWCVNAKGIKGVSCPSKFYGIVAVGKPVLGVLEKNSEIEKLMTDIGCGLVSEPGDYDRVEENIRWFIDNAGEKELAGMGIRGHDYLVAHLTKGAGVSKYIELFKE